MKYPDRLIATRYILPLLLLAAVLLGSGIGCSSARRGVETPVKLGVILPLSGENAEYGREILAGMECAKTYLLQEFGSDTALPELVIRDDAGKAALAKAAMRKLDDADCAAVLVGYTSDEALAVKEEAARLRLPTLTPAGTNDEITARNPYMFRANFSDAQQGRALAYYAFFRKRCRRMAVLLNLDENAVYSRDLGRQTAQAFVNYGGMLTHYGSYQEGDRDFSAELKKLIATGPDVIFIPAYPATAGRIAKQARALGFGGLLLGGDGWNGSEFLRNCGPAVAPAVFASPFSVAGRGAVCRRFVELFRQRYHREPTANAALGFDSVLLAFIAVRNTVNSDEVLAQVPLIRSFEGAAGNLAMLPDGRVRRNVIMHEVVLDENNQPVFRAQEVLTPGTVEGDEPPVKEESNGIFD